jgi:hypothetical protein
VAAVLMGSLQRMRQPALGSLLLGASILLASPALAELELRWNAPATCPSRSEVLERIERLAGSAIDQTDGLSLEGTIEQADGRYRLTLLVRSDGDVRRRVIESEKCADLAGAAAVTVALLLGVDMSSIEQATDGAQGGTSGAGGAGAGTAGTGGENQNSPDGRKQAGGTSGQSAEPEPKPVPPPDTSKSSSTGGGAAFILRAPILAADLGPLPHPAFGVGLGAGMRYDAWRIILAGRYSLKQTVDAPDSGGAFGAELSRLTGELSACYGFRLERFEVAPCVGLALEYLNARGFGEEVTPSSERTIWPAPSAGGVAHWYALESLALFVGITGYVEVSRPRIVIEGLGEVDQLAPAAIGAMFGAEWIL